MKTAKAFSNKFKAKEESLFPFILTAMFKKEYPLATTIKSIAANFLSEFLRI